jgi:hypothetical protein
MTRTFALVATWHRHFGFILQLFEAMPRWFVALTDPSAVAMLDFFDVSLTNFNIFPSLLSLMV